MSKITERAEAVAARVDQSIVGFDPITILTIITTVLPLLAQCFNRNDEPDPVETAAAVRDMHDHNPRALQKRTARRIRAESDEPMTKAASFELARAVIAEALETDPETVSACVTEAVA